MIVIALITVANLRGLRESGNIFAVPTYLFVAMALVIVASGLYHIATGTATPLPHQPEAVPLGTEALGIFLLLRAFAGGAVALTGVEAIANGVPAFKPPESRNAANTMTGDGDPAGHPVHRHHVRRQPVRDPVHDRGGGGPTAIAQVVQHGVRGRVPAVRAVPDRTALILFLAVNTSFNAFPRLAAILAEDGFMPRQFSFRGDRLAFSWGIVVLAAVAAVLLVDLPGRRPPA